MRRPTIWDACREARLYPWKPAAVAVPLLLLGWLIHHFWPAARPGHWLLAMGVLMALGAAAWWWWDRLARPLDTGTQIRRETEHANHNDGAASKWDIWQYASAWSWRRSARIVRPSLAYLPRAEMRRIAPREFSVCLARVGWGLGLLGGTAIVRASLQWATLRLGGPQIGKSGSLACVIRDAPGPVICTSTRFDLLDATRESRAARGNVDVFNPTGLGGIPSTFRWSALQGCEDYTTAQRRAAAMVEIGEGQAKDWDEQARAIFGVLLHAAALHEDADGRRTGRLDLVLTWVERQTPETLEQVVTALQSSANRVNLLSMVRHHWGMNDRTRTSITNSVIPALQWLSIAGCVEVGDAPRDQVTWDPASFLSTGADSVYLIGAADDSAAVAPLLSALTAEVAHAARMVAGLKPRGRLDPPLAMVLDEVTLAARQIPLAQWTSDMGGLGVTIHLAVQSLAQLRDAWGRDKTESILNNTGALLIFGGTKATTDLADLERLLGQRLEILDEDDRRYTATMSASRISSLKQFEVIVAAGGLRPVQGRAPMVWDRPHPAVAWLAGIANTRVGPPSVRRRVPRPRAEAQPEPAFTATVQGEVV